jgi:hypothetical protein
MRRLLLTHLAVLALGCPAGAAMADQKATLRATWEERDGTILAFSPDGRTLLTSGHEGVRLRDADTGRVRSVLVAPPGGIYGRVFSPDGRLLFAKVASDRFKPVTVFDLKVWDVATGKVHATIAHSAEHPRVFIGPFALSPDGRTLAFEDNSERLPMQIKTSKMVVDGRELDFEWNANPGLPRVKIWDVPRWKEIALVDGGLQMVFSPDGKTLVTGSRDWRNPTASVWDAATGKLRCELVGKAQWRKSMTFSPDGKFLAIGGSGDQTLWEVASGKKWAVPVRLSGMQSPVFSPDGLFLFPNGLPRGNPQYNMNQDFPCYDLSTLPPRPVELGEGQFVVQPLTYREGRLLISLASGRYANFSEAAKNDHRTVVIHDLHTRKELGRFVLNRLLDAEYSPDGRWLAVCESRFEATDAGPGNDLYRRYLWLLDPEAGRIRLTIPTPEPIWGDPRWTFSPDGRSIAVSYLKGKNTDPGITERAHSIDLWDLPRDDRRADPKRPD